VRVPRLAFTRGKAALARLWTRTPANPLVVGLSELPWHQFDRLHLVSHRPASAGPGGEHLSRLRAPAIDFFDHRAYQVGDDPRWIDWNVYGRLGSLQVKVTQAEERLHLFLVLDCSASMDWGEPSKFRRAVEAIAALAYIGLRQAAVVRIVCLAEQRRTLGPVTGRNRFPDVLRFLTATAPGGSLTLAEALERIPTLLPLGTQPVQPLIVLVSDLLVEEPSDLARAFDVLLGQGADVALLHLLSPQEESPEPLGEVELVDAETGQRVSLGLTMEAISAYRQRLSAWLASIERLCTERGLRYTRACTDRPLEWLLIEDLRRAQLVR